MTIKLWRSANQPRRSKYGSRRVPHDEHMHDSVGERDRCFVLQRLEAEHAIVCLNIHPVFHLKVDGSHICDYIPDWDYYDENGAHVVEDFKGVATPVYRLKKRLMLALHGIDVKETHR